MRNGQKHIKMAVEKIEVGDLEPNDAIWVREYKEYLVVENISENANDQYVIEFDCGKVIFSNKNRKFELM